MFLIDRYNGRAFDLAPSLATRRVYVVASLPRTGSTLLCRALWDTGRVGAPKEYLNPTAIRDWEVRFGTPASKMRHLLLWGRAAGLAGLGRWDRDRLERHLLRVMERRTGANGWFGTKLHLHHYRQWSTHGSLLELLQPQKWIFVTRSDRIAAAVSWEKALQNGQWASHQRAFGKPRFDRSRLMRRLDEIGRMEAEWEVLFDQRGIEPLRLTYENLVADWTGSVRSALGHLGEDALEVPAPALVRQADSVNEEWARRLRRL